MLAANSFFVLQIAAARHQTELTVANLFPLLAKGVIEAPTLQPIPLLIIVPLAQLGPLEDAFAKGDPVHADDAEPQERHLPFRLDHAEQRHAKSRLAHCLADDGEDGRSVDENVHAVVPAALGIPCCVFDGDGDVARHEDRLEGRVVSTDGVAMRTVDVSKNLPIEDV